MTRYYITVDVPFEVVVEAPNEEDAEILGDALVSEAYDLAAKELSDHMVGLGYRYDDTEVSRAE